MAKKKTAARKSGGAAAIETVDDEQFGSRMPIEEANETADAHDVSHAESNGTSAKPQRKPKAKSEPKSDGNLGIGEIRKAATFANSVGGLDKAIALLQVLKVAKEVQ